MTATATRRKTRLMDRPLRIRVSLEGRCAVARVERFTVDAAGNLVAMDADSAFEATQEGRMHLYERGLIRTPFPPDRGAGIPTAFVDAAAPTVEELRACGKKPNGAATRGPRNLGMEDEPQEYEPSPYDGTYFEC